MSQKPEVVSTIKRSQGVVSSLLLTEYSVAVVAIAFKSNQLTGKYCWRFSHILEYSLTIMSQSLPDFLVKVAVN